jgi:hypothetical protein
MCSGWSVQKRGTTKDAKIAKGRQIFLLLGETAAPLPHPEIAASHRACGCLLITQFPTISGLSQRTPLLVGHDPAMMLGGEDEAADLLPDVPMGEVDGMDG